MTADAVELLRFPHPYRAAATVCSDTHAATPARFAAVQTLVKTRERIARGSDTWRELFTDPAIDERPEWRDGIEGFGLPIGDSIWLFDSTIGVFRGFDEASGAALPHRLTDGRDFADVVDDWIRRGWVDVLHTGGPAGLTREAMRAGLDWLAAEPARRLRVWVNHNIESTPSCIEPDVQRGLPVVLKNGVRLVTWALHSLGAERLGLRFDFQYKPLRFPPGQVLLCWALLASFVASCLWLAASLLLPALRTWLSVLAGGAWLGLTLAVLHRLPMRYAQGDNPGTPYYNLDLVRAAGFRYFKLIMDRGGYEGTDLRQLPVPEFDWNGRSSYLRVAPVDDGSRIVVFPRTSKGPNGRRALELFTDEALHDLAERSGTAILLTHWINEAPQVFTARGLDGLACLRRHHEAGRVWVAPTDRIVHFEFVRTFLRYAVRSEGAGLVLDVEAVDDPIDGAFVPMLDDLRGISFRVPARAELEVRLAGAAVPPDRLEWIADGPERVVRFGAAG